MRALVLLIATTVLWAQKPLTISEARLHQYEDGPSLPASSVFHPGETVFVSFVLENYRAANEKVHLKYELQALDPAGRPVVAPKQEVIQVELAPEDKNWKPKVRGSAEIPLSAPGGSYKLVIRASDELAPSAAAVKEVPFTVQGREVAASDTLVVRDFGFFRKDEDTQPLASPSFRPGEPIWMRFDVTGYKTGEQNRFEVGFGFDVVNAEGKAIISAPQAGAEKDAPFYPKRYLPLSLNITTTPDTPKGAYTVVFRFQDAVGGQTYEHRAPFRLE